MIGDSATFVPVPHDWTSDVVIEPVVPTSVLAHDDGSEQRIALSHLSTERVTYRLLPPTHAQAVTLRLLPELAADAWVRVPRWEDQARLSAAVSAGSAVVVPCDTTSKPTFAEGRQVILWRSASEYEVTTCDALSDTDVTADLASDWGAGTIIAPVMAGRMVYPLSLTHWLPTTGALEFVVDFDLTDIAGVGTGGAGTTGVAAAIEVHGVMPVGQFGRAPVFAVVTDAEGNVIAPLGIVWTSSDSTNAPVWASSEPGVALVGNPNATGADVTITATIGAVSAGATVSLE